MGKAIVIFLISFFSLISLGNTETFGLRFQETLSGHVTMGGVDIPCSADLEMKLLDVDKWSADKNHVEQLKGFFNIQGKKIPVEGTFALMKKNDKGNGYFIVYSFSSVGSETLSFDGHKTIHNTSGHRSPTVASTLLLGDLRAGQENGPVVLLFDLKNEAVVESFAHSFTVFRVTDGSPTQAPVSSRLKAHVYKKFLKVFLGGFGSEYLYFWKYFEKNP